MKTVIAATTAAVCINVGSWAYAKGGAHPPSRCSQSSTAGHASATVSVTAELNRTNDPYSPGAPGTCCRRPVDLVICLDTSGSMTALIDSARAKLWEIVNEIARHKPTPYLRVALLTYGSPNLSTVARGWIVRQIDLTDDLDAVYAKMMSMSTFGGDEFVGWVLNDAVQTMSWSTDPAAARLIFVAGNESADQAAEHFNFRGVAERARSKRIIINAIYAGNHDTGVAEHWDQVALHGGGCYSAIDMQKGTVQITTPFDAVLIKLNAELNATYVPFGKLGSRGAANQKQQDRNAGAVGREAAASRVAAKATGLYSNSQWDLVDAAERESRDPAALPAEELPEPMQSMTAEEKQDFVQSMSRARKQIQQKIQDVSDQRQEFLVAARKQQDNGGIGLDDALKTILKEQLNSAPND